jgi:hypothetical protein
MIRRLAVALVAASTLAVGLTGCGSFGGGGKHGRVTSLCRTTGTDGTGQCALKLSLGERGSYDYVVSGQPLPVLGGGVQVSAYVATTTPVRVSWHEAAGRDAVTVVEPGRPRLVRGVASVQDQGGEQRFIVHFQLSGSGASTVDATITYG